MKKIRYALREGREDGSRSRVPGHAWRFFSHFIGDCRGLAACGRNFLNRGFVAAILLASADKKARKQAQGPQTLDEKLKQLDQQH